MAGMSTYSTDKCLAATVVIMTVFQPVGNNKGKSGNLAKKNHLTKKLFRQNTTIF